MNQHVGSQFEFCAQLFVTYFTCNKVNVYFMCIFLVLFPMTKGKSFRIYKVDKMNMVAFLEDKFPEVREFKEEFRMNHIGSPNEIISDMGKQSKRGPSQLTPNKRVILGRKNQLIRMMKKRGEPDLLKSRYLRIN